MFGAPCVLLILPGRPAVDERAPRAGLVCYAAPFRPCWVRGLSAHQRCSISTGRYQRPPGNPGVGGGRRLPRDSHGCRCPSLLTRAKVTRLDIGEPPAVAERGGQGGGAGFH